MLDISIPTESVYFWAGVLVGLLALLGGFMWLMAWWQNRDFRRAKKASEKNKPRPPN